MRAATITGATARKPPPVQGKRCAPPRGGGSASACIKYVLGEELTAKVQHDRVADNALTAGQRSGLSSLLDEARQRPDLGANKIWKPAGGGNRPSAIYARGVSSLATAATHMEAVARTQPRVKQRVQHYVISLNERESQTVNDEQLIRAVENVLDRAGWSGHQAIFAVHRDKGNAHCHVALASVNPDTLLAWNRQSDYYRLHHALRETETRFCMEHENGLAIVGLSTKFIEWASLQYQTVHQFVAKLWPILLAIAQFEIAGLNFSKLDELVSMEATRMVFKDNPWVNSAWLGMLGSVRLGLIPLLLVYFVIASLTDVIDDSTFYMNLITMALIVIYAFIGLAWFYWKLVQTHGIPHYFIITIIVALILAAVLLITRSRTPKWRRALRNVLLQEAIILLFSPLALVVFQRLSWVFAVIVFVALLIPLILEKLFPTPESESINQAVPVDQITDECAKFTLKRKRLLTMFLVSAFICIILNYRNEQPTNPTRSMVTAPPMQMYSPEIRHSLWLIDSPWDASYSSDALPLYQKR